MIASRRLFVASGLAAAACASDALAAQPQSELDLSRYAGKVLYLDFWASWCAPCQLSFPYMERLLTLFPAQDFALLAVSVDHDQAAANAFLQHFGGQVPVAFDPHGAVARRFDIRAMPTSFLIGRDGRTRFTHSGFFPEQIPAYDLQISELIHEH